MAAAHAETVRASYEALNRGDVEGALAALDDAVEWRESPELPNTGVYRGAEAVRAFLEEFLDSWQEFHQEVEDLRIAGDRVCAVLRLRARGRASDAEVVARYAHLWTLREGRAVRVDAYYDPERALADLAQASPATPATSTLTRKAT